MHAPHDKARTDKAKPPVDAGKRAGALTRWVRAEVATVALVVAALAVAAGAAWWAGSNPGSAAQQKGAGFAQQKGKGPGGRALGVPVETAVARAISATTDIPAIGSIRSDEHVQIAPEVAGRIAEIRFQEGEPVKEGEVLVRLDDALAQAEVADAEARFNLAKANFDRADTLSKSRNIAERAYDEAKANFETSRAAVELARVRLAKHTIRAPFSGIVGIRPLSVGAYVSIGASLVNLEKIDVLKVDFKVPEIYLADVRVGQAVEVSVDALPGRTFPGEIYAVDPLVDVNGRALQVRARLKNPDHILRPGLFARIVVKGQREREVVLVPESAVVPRGGETFIYRIQEGKAVESKVTLGQRRQGEVEIVDGLAAGATIVTAGHQRLRNGSVVDVVGTAPSQERGG